MSTDYFLAHGNHPDPADGRCAMEWVAYIAGEEHSDSPKCVSPVLRTYGMSLNDRWDDDQRQKLRPYLARCIGTAGDGRDQERGWLAMDWLIREFTPKFMELVPLLYEHVTALRSLDPVRSPEALDDAMILLRTAQKASAAAWDAAGAAAWDAAWDAAGAAAWDAARDAAWDAARAAAGDAAGAAAGAAAGDAAGDAAWDAAGAAARAAAGDAAGAAAGAAARAAAGDAAWDAARAAAGAAARAAARDALKPTVDALQASALDLFDRMLPTELIGIPAVSEQEWRAVCALVAGGSSASSLTTATSPSPSRGWPKTTNKATLPGEVVVALAGGPSAFLAST